LTNSTQIYVRGALGTQFLSVFFLSTERDLEFNKIILSAGGSTLAEHCKIMYLWDYLEPKFYCTSEVDMQSTHKSFNVNAWPEMTKEEYRKRVKEFYRKWEVNFIFGWRSGVREHDVILHARGTDNKFLTEDKLAQIAKKYDSVAVTGEDSQLISRIQTITDVKNISSDDPVYDWYTLQNAKEVHGGCSTFMLSAAMLSPETQFVFYQTPDMNPNSKIISDRIVSVLDNARIECFGH